MLNDTEGGGAKCPSALFTFTTNMLSYSLLKDPLFRLKHSSLWSPNFFTSSPAVAAALIPPTSESKWSLQQYMEFVLNQPPPATAQSPARSAPNPLTTQHKISAAMALDHRGLLVASYHDVKQVELRNGLAMTTLPPAVPTKKGRNRKHVR